MNAESESILKPSEFKNLTQIEYFRFEEDFIENGVRCIPMIVRFKLDLAQIKLNLAEWNRFNSEEKIMLATMDVSTPGAIDAYTSFLTNLIEKHCNHQPTYITGEISNAWKNEDKVPELLKGKALEFNWKLSQQQWRSLSELQRFALLKLCRAGHENRNFPIAMKEFGLI